MRSIAVLLAALSVLSTAACTVGPDYKRPIVVVPDTYRGAASDGGPAPSAVSLGDQKWWDVFQDDQLRSLLTAAVRQNFDVRIAAARILQAQAQLGIVRADQFPTVDAGAGSARGMAGWTGRGRARGGAAGRAAGGAAGAASCGGGEGAGAAVVCSAHMG